MSKSSDNINRNRFTNPEFLLLGSSIGSSVAAIIFQQVAFAAITSIPLSLAISLNSRNRRRLEEVDRQYKASVTHLEQKFSDKQEYTDKVLYSLPTRSELSDLEKRLEVYNATFVEQLTILKQRQDNADLELHKIDIYRQKFADAQQRLSVLESLLQSYNPTPLNPELKETLVGVEGKLNKLERQFTNLPLSSLQHQLTQVQQIVDKLQVRSIESTQLDKCLLGEIQHISQQIQSINSKTQELSLAHTEIQNQLNLFEALDFKKISSEAEFLYTFIDTEFQAFVARFEEKTKILEEQTLDLPLRIQERLAQVEQLVSKLQTTAKKDPEKKVAIDSTKRSEILCQHCHQPITGKYVMGSYFNDYKFHLDCKQVYEKKHL